MKGAAIETAIKYSVLRESLLEGGEILVFNMELRVIGFSGDELPSQCYVDEIANRKTDDACSPVKTKCVLIPRASLISLSLWILR